MKNNKNRGFTLLELLIVIAIIAILSVALVLVLNPAETLRKSRDAQRISDLSTMKTALGIYLTSNVTPTLGDAGSNATCSLTPGDPRGALGLYKIWYSTPSTDVIADVTLDGSTAVTPKVQVATPALTDGTGWIPVNFGSLSGGSPISNIPVDPTNNLAVGTSSLSSVTSQGLAYRYACSQSPLAFEIDGQLESTAYTIDDDKRVSDGGNSALYYETGTNLLILGAGGTTALDF